MSAAVWRRARREILTHEWDGEAVVYDIVSGDTHHLDPLAAEIFDRLEEAPADQPAMCRSIAEAFAIADDGSLAERVAEALNGLSRTKLVERQS